VALIYFMLSYPAAKLVEAIERKLNGHSEKSNGRRRVFGFQLKRAS